jgi:uncharacterized Fe-S center protein
MESGETMGMSDVYWADLGQMTPENSVPQKLQRLLEQSGAAAGFEEGMRISLKINTAEEGYEYGLRPTFLRTVADASRAATERSPILCDGLKLVDYGRRTKGHAFMDVARAKGYTSDALGGNFVINGGYSGDEGNTYSCRRPDAELGGVEVGTAVCRTDRLWVLAHVTLHPLFGLAGALYNGGFECLVGRERMRILAGVDPYPFNGRRPDGDALRSFQRRALEGHLGVREAMGDRVFYVNYVWDVTPRPEYFPFSEGPVVPNLGFLASADPVALDAATARLMGEALTEAGKAIDPIQDRTGADFAQVLSTAEEWGLGTRGFTLHRLS